MGKGLHCYPSKRCFIAGQSGRIKLDAIQPDFPTSFYNFLSVFIYLREIQSPFGHQSVKSCDCSCGDKVMKTQYSCGLTAFPHCHNKQIILLFFIAYSPKNGLKAFALFYKTPCRPVWNLDYCISADFLPSSYMRNVRSLFSGVQVSVTLLLSSDRWNGEVRSISDGLNVRS